MLCLESGADAQSKRGRKDSRLRTQPLLEKPIEWLRPRSGNSEGQQRCNSVIDIRRQAPGRQ
eukprot:4921169-Pleurochrysis_carterae.AAC.1